MKDNFIPQHIAVIMDGNRRWARKRGLPVLAGHKKVTDEILEPLIEHAAQKGVKYMTFWAWSTENWERDKKEVVGIMKIFRTVINRRWKRLHEKGVRVRVIGDISKFDPVIRKSLEKVMEETKNNKTITVIFGLNYGGRDELVRAVNKAISYQLSAIRDEQRKKGHLAESWKLTAESFENFLDTAGIPDPDIIVRTGGAIRMSGFLPWQSEYSEFYFAEWYMPEFTPEKFDEIIDDFQKRKRRFGK